MEGIENHEKSEFDGRNMIMNVMWRKRQANGIEEMQIFRFDHYFNSQMNPQKFFLADK